MPEEELFGLVDLIFEGITERTPVGDSLWDWKVSYVQEEKEKTAKVSFYPTDDGKTEAHVEQTIRTHDGPVIEVEDFEDIIFPARAANLDPPSPSNPRGAGYVARLCTATLDTIKRKMQDGTYDLLTEEGFKKIEETKSPVGGGSDTEAPKEQKDEMEGVSPSSPEDRNDRETREWYGRLDVDGDGLEEDVILWLAPDAKVCMGARYLTEVYPGLPIRRPINHGSFIPVPNTVYGISLPEIVEAIQDMMQIVMDQHIDWGTLTNMPFFTYRQASGIPRDDIHIEPGSGIPLDDPEHDFKIPQFPQRDSSFTINTMTILQQFSERLSMFSDASYGRVPQGKASAFRTTGTTMALLSQGDVRAEQVLRRLFCVLAGAFSMMHRLNRRYLPDKKEFRALGVPEASEDLYPEMGAEDLDAEMDFEFKATLLNTNKQLVAATLKENAALLVAPLAIQLGIVTPEHIYNLLRDILLNSDMDPDRYLGKPADYINKPRLMATEVLSAILEGNLPDAYPMEPPLDHLEAFMALIQARPELIEGLSGQQKEMITTWMQTVGGIIQEENMRLQMAALAQQGAGGAQQGGNGGTPGPVPMPQPNPMGQPNPPVNKKELVDESAGMQ